MTRKPRFSLILPFAFVLTVAGAVAFAFGAGGVPGIWDLCADWRIPTTIVSVSFILAIPTYLFSLNAYDSARVREAERSQPVEGVVHPAHLAKYADLHIYLWLLFVALTTATPALWLLGSPNEQPRDLQATTTPPMVVAPPVVEEAPATSTDLSLLPMYGGVEKTPEIVAADEALVNDLTMLFGSKEEAASSTIRGAWTAFDAGNTDTAIRRFNQACLVDPNDPRAYWGMGVVEGVRKNYDSSIVLLAYAIKIGGTEPRLYCDLAASYLNASKVERSTSTYVALLDAADTLLNDAVARGAVLPPYCYGNWEKIARLRGDTEGAALYALHRTEVTGSSTEMLTASTTQGEAMTSEPGRF